MTENPTAPADNGTPELTFTVTGVAPARLAAVPTLLFPTRIDRTGGGPIRSITLTTSVRIAPAKRRYQPDEVDLLADVFGAPEHWATTMRALPWARVNTAIPPFDANTVTDIPVECGHDIELAVAKYFQAVRGGDVPLEFLFSGTVFHIDEQAALRTSRISWTTETTFPLPAALWHEAVEGPQGHRWVRMSSTGFQKLYEYRSEQGLSDWDAVVNALLPSRNESDR